jgi:hypothetical protein
MGTTGYPTPQPFTGNLGLDPIPVKYLNDPFPACIYETIQRFGKNVFPYCQFTSDVLCANGESWILAGAPVSDT